MVESLLFIGAGTGAGAGAGASEKNTRSRPKTDQLQNTVHRKGFLIHLDTKVAEPSCTGIMRC